MKQVFIAVLLSGTLVFMPCYAKIERSVAAKDSFKKQHPCPSNGHTSGACPGFVIDHIKALACGGLDDPSNMQWQTVADAKAKDKIERKGCEVKPQPAIGQYFIGKRGGCYTFSGGKKRYVNRSFCGL